MKLNKMYVTGLLAAAALSSCGRNDYNGTYAGTATNGQGGMNGQQFQTTTQGQFNNFQQPFPNNNNGALISQDQVTLTLNQNGEQVQGSYSSQSGETGNFYANARSSNRLDSVQLNIQQYQQQGTNDFQGGYQQMQNGFAAYCAGSFYTGNLNAPDDARQIEGTLQAAGGASAQNPQCQSKTFRLFKNGNNR